MADIAELGLFIDSSGVIRATKDLRKLHGQTGKNENANQKLSKSYGGLKAAIATVGIVALTKKLITQMNTYTALSNRLKLVTTGTENLTAVQDELFRVAQDSRGSLEATNDLYFRLAKSTESLGVSQTRLVGVTETINKAIALSGVSSEAASAALTQLGQGMASGTLRGEELNSVLEQTPRLAQAIADGMGVEVGRLRALAAEGEITTEVIVAAIESQAGVVSSEMSSMAKTVDQAFQQIENTALRTFGTIDSKDLVSGLDEFRNIISDPEIVSGLQSIAGVMVDIVGLAVKAAAGWGMIFSEIGKLAAPDSPIAKMQDLIAATQKSMDNASSEVVKAATQRLLDQYKVQLSALTEAQAAKVAEESGGETGLTGGGDDAVAEAAARAMAVAEAERAVRGEAIADEFFDEMDRREILLNLEYEAAQNKREARELEAQEVADHYDRLYNLQTGSQQASYDFTKAIRSMDYKGMLASGALMLSGLAKNSKSIFKIQKAAALANAAVNLPSAVLTSFERGGGFPWGLIPAGLMLAQGMQQISAIKSASFGGGVSSPSVGGGGGGSSPSMSVASGLPDGSTAVPSGAEQPTVREMRVVIESDGVHSEGMRKFATDLAETIEDMGGVGKLVVS